MSAQTLSSLPHWVSTAVELSAGDPEAMPLEPSASALVPILYALCFLAFLPDS